MHVVVAVDKFKGSLTAHHAASALGRGILHAAPSTKVTRVPIADGGDGTLAAAIAAGFAPVHVTVEGPTGEPVHTAYARRGAVAVVELADASGLNRLPGEPAPLRASTIGTGQLLAAAIKAGCTRLVLGLGGSCSTDGGAGIAMGLGARVLDVNGQPVSLGGAALLTATQVDLTPLLERLAGVSVILASDVDNPLTGPRAPPRSTDPRRAPRPQMSRSSNRD